MPGPGDRGRAKEKPKDAKGALLRILKYLMAYRWWVALLFVCAVASNLGNLMGPRFAGKAIGVVEEGAKLGAGHVDMSAVLRYMLLMLGAYVGSNLLGFLVSINMSRIGRRVAQNLRKDVFDKLMRLPVSYFVATERISNDISVLIIRAFCYNI